MRDERSAMFALPAAALLLAAVQMPAPEPTIGVASKEADGTIILTLRAEGPGGAIGDGQIRYPPGHKDYAMIADHIGPIPDKGSVPVKPFAKQ